MSKSHEVMDDLIERAEYYLEMEDKESFVDVLAEIISMQDLGTDIQHDKINELIERQTNGR